MAEVSYTVFNGGGVLLLILILVIGGRQSEGQCEFQFNKTVYNFSKCKDLSSQDATIAWNYHGSNSSIDLAFSGKAPSNSGWVGWGINPKTPNQMVGSSVLIAFQSSDNGSNVLPYKLTNQIQTSQKPLACSPVDIIITSTAVEITGPPPS